MDNPIGYYYDIEYCIDLAIVWYRLKYQLDAKPYQRPGYDTSA